MKDRNILRCVLCGAEIITQAKERNCYKCESMMKFISKEGEQDIK